MDGETGVRAATGFVEPKSPSRRSFLNFLLGLSVVSGFGVVVYTILRYLWPTEGVRGSGAQTGQTVIPLSEIPVGEAKTVRHLGQPHIVIRLAEGVHALNAVCTHLGCIVYWDGANRVLPCPCHDAFFDLNGNVLKGPPPRPLPKVDVRIAGDEIILT